MYDPFADELRLGGGDGRLNSPSAPLALDMALLSPVPLSKLGELTRLDAAPADCRARTPYPELLAFGFLIPLSELRCLAGSRRLPCVMAPLMSESEVEVDSGLGGRLDTRGLLDLGGSGKAPMLVVLRKVLAGVGKAEEGVPYSGDAEEDGVMLADVSVVLRVGTAGVERIFAGFGVGRPEGVTDRETAARGGGGMAEPDEPGRASGDASDTSCSGFRVFATGSAGRGPEGGAWGEVGGRRRPVDVMVADMERGGSLFRCCGAPSARRRPPLQCRCCASSLVMLHRKITDPLACRTGSCGVSQWACVSIYSKTWIPAETPVLVAGVCAGDVEGIEG